MLYDPTTPFGARVERRLREEEVIWLTTVRRDGTPQPNPVWFVWNGETLLIYTLPDSFKVRNIRRSPRVSLHFDSGVNGEDVVVFTGTASLDENAPTAQENPAYLEKYGEDIVRIGLTPKSMSASYSVAIRVKPEKVRGF